MEDISMFMNEFIQIIFYIDIYCYQFHLWWNLVCELVILKCYNLHELIVVKKYQNPLTIFYSNFLFSRKGIAILNLKSK